MAITPQNRIKSVQIDSSVNNIPTAYSTAAGSKVLTSLGYPRKYYGIYIYNASATAIVMRPANVDDGTPSASDGTDGQEICIPPSVATMIPNVLVLDNLFLRSAGSAISSGKVYITIFGV